MGADPSHIFFLNAKHNWWIPGTSGPCGPDTEIFFDTGKEKCCDECSPACDCGKYLEIWNNVFMQYFQPANGEIRMLEKKNVDTGMGLERTIATLQGAESVYDTDAFAHILARISELSGKNYRDNAETTRAFRIVADHIRTSAFMLGDPRSVTPSNVDQGYILRRLIRRALRYAMQLGMPETHSAKLPKPLFRITARSIPNCAKTKPESFANLTRRRQDSSALSPTVCANLSASKASLKTV